MTPSFLIKINQSLWLNARLAQFKSTFQNAAGWALECRTLIRHVRGPGVTPHRHKDKEQEKRHKQNAARVVFTNAGLELSSSGLHNLSLPPPPHFGVLPSPLYRFQEGQLLPDRPTLAHLEPVQIRKQHLWTRKQSPG